MLRWRVCVVFACVLTGVLHCEPGRSQVYSAAPTIEPGTDINLEIPSDSSPAVLTSQPELVVATVANDGAIEILRQVTRMMTTEETAIVFTPHGIQEETHQVHQPVVETSITRMPAGMFECRRIDGSAVPTEELLEALADPTPAIYLEPGQTLDPVIGGMFLPETLVMQVQPPLAPATVPTPVQAGSSP